jgi:cytochrome c oxidase subunit 2
MADLADGNERRRSIPGRTMPLRHAVWALLVMSVVAGGCQLPTFGERHPVTKQGVHTLKLWQGFFITALCVGGLVMGLILFAAVRFRRRSDVIPSQKADKLWLEVVYTITPVLIVIVLFTASVMTAHAVDDSGTRPDLTVNVVGFQWGWQFSYPGRHISITGSGVDHPPILVLPRGETARLVLRTRDVNHSFWVPDFLEKRDLIEGVDNAINVTPTQLGTFDGKCAEYCSLDHWRMTFILKVVTPQRFAAELAAAQRSANRYADETSGSPS